MIGYAKRTGSTREEHVGMCGADPLGSLSVTAVGRFRGVFFRALSIMTTYLHRF